MGRDGDVSHRVHRGHRVERDEVPVRRTSFAQGHPSDEEMLDRMGRMGRMRGMGVALRQAQGLRCASRRRRSLCTDVQIQAAWPWGEIQFRERGHGEIIRSTISLMHMRVDTILI